MATYPAIERGSAERWITIEEPERRGGRYLKAVELRPGDLQEQLEACGRSPLGRAVEKGSCEEGPCRT